MKKLLLTLTLGLLYTACSTPIEELILPVGQSIDQYLIDNPGAKFDEKYESYDTMDVSVSDGVFIKWDISVYFDENRIINDYSASTDTEGGLDQYFTPLKNKYQRTIGEGQTRHEVDDDGWIEASWEGNAIVNGEYYIVTVSYYGNGKGDSGFTDISIGRKRAK